NHGSHSSWPADALRARHEARLMFIPPVLALAIGVAIGLLIGWLAGRPEQARLRTEVDKERALHAERLRAYDEAQTRLREAFQALSAEALKSNTSAFLQLAETRMRDARTEAVADLDARRHAVDALIAPIAKALDQMDREIRDAERRRVESTCQLLQRIALLDSTGQDLRSQTARLVDALKRPGVRGRWGELQLKRVVELAG